MTAKLNIKKADEMLMNKILLIRGQKVMLDRDLAEMYVIETRVLNQAVSRNKERFPEDFMFQLNEDEFENWKSQFVMSKSDFMSIRRKPYAFTEHGVLMLSSVLRSETAIQVNIQIIRIFTKMREMLMTNKDILLKLEKMENKLIDHDKSIQEIFFYLKKLLVHNTEKQERKPIGFKTLNKI